VLPLLGIVFMREATTSRYLFLAGAVLLPAVVALPAMLFVLNYHIAAYLVTGVFAGLALLFYLATFVSYFGSDIGGGSGASAGVSRASRSPRARSSVSASAPSDSGSEESE
jgi:membrane glycosyltransferase